MATFPITVHTIARAIEENAPLRYQEGYDNAGMQVGNRQAEVRGVLLCTDVTPAVVQEAVERGRNLIVSHHPLIFHGLKKIARRDYVECIVEQAIKHDINIYSAHTNMDNTPGGVSWHMARKLELEFEDLQVLEGRRDDAIAPLGGDIPVLYGSGVIGSIAPMPMLDFLRLVKTKFRASVVRYGGSLRGEVSRVALCGGAGAFLIDEAIAQGADVLITGDVKYHEFMKSMNGIVVADIGHYESEQFTKEIFFEIIQGINPTFAVDFARKEENQINYLL
ncbi:MAG: Nif3-like dinuclear metal center hexameric protein [Muribaculaceae bacterium]|nr:Nif3-like dinuclear metal center hexameric protein [Muribaculaceae bacterium]